MEILETSRLAAHGSVSSSRANDIENFAMAHSLDDISNDPSPDLGADFFLSPAHTQIG